MKVAKASDGVASEDARVEADRPDLFVSYTREDTSFVRRLIDALSGYDQRAWVDWRDIPPTADWRRKVFAGIDAARAFVFVLSPDALGSTICMEELEHAAQSSKRIVPILYRPVEDGRVPAALAKPNWIRFDEDEGFGAAVDSLVDALQSDLVWRDAHARLLVRATEWDQSERDPSFLLRGTDLKVAEDWIGQQREHEQAPTVLQSEYILAGRRAATRRQRSTVSALVAGLAAVSVLAAAALLQRNQAVANEHIAVSRELAANAIAQLEVDPELSVLLAREAVSVEPTIQAEEALRIALGRSWVRVRMTGHRGAVTTATFSADGRSLLTTGNDGTVREWDAASGRSRRVIGEVSRGGWSAVSPNGGWAVTPGKDRTARLWNLHENRPPTSIRHDPAVLRGGAPVFSRDGRLVLTLDDATTASIRESATSKLVARLKGIGREQILGARFSPDARSVVTFYDALDKSAARVWDTHTGQLLATLASPGNLGQAMSFSPDSKLITSQTFGGSVFLWEARSGRRVASLRGNSTSSFATAFSGDGKVVAAATGDDFTVSWGDYLVRLWDVRTKETRTVLRGHTRAIEHVEFSPDGALVATAGDDGTARIWERETGRALRVFRGHQGSITSLTFSPDGKRIATTSEDGTARVWELTGQRTSPTSDLDPAQELVGKLSFSSDGKLIATGTKGGTVRLWDQRTGKVTETSTPLSWTSAALGPGGRVATSGGATVEVHDLKSGEMIASLSHQGAELDDPVFSPDGSVVAALADNRTVPVWDLHAQDIKSVVDATGSPTSLAFSPNGRVLAVGTETGIVQLWNWVTGKPEGELRGHSDEILDIAFDSTGRLILTGSADGTARVWEAARRRPLVVFRGHTGRVNGVAFSPDDQVAITGSIDRTLRYWDVHTGVELASDQVVRRADSHPEDDLIGDVAVSPDSRVVATGHLTKVRLYPCDVCGSLADLQARVRTRVTRTLTSQERQLYLHAR